ncbi:MAG: hypothetical protein ACP5NY_04575 [Thermocladium sp.]
MNKTLDLLLTRTILMPIIIFITNEAQLIGVKPLIIIVEENLGAAVMLLSDETGLPVINDVGPGILPIRDASQGAKVLSRLSGMDELPQIIIVISRTVWSNLMEKMAPLDVARLLMRIEVRTARL